MIIMYYNNIYINFSTQLLKAALISSLRRGSIFYIITAYIIASHIVCLYIGRFKINARVGSNLVTMLLYGHAVKFRIYEGRLDITVRDSEIRAQLYMYKSLVNFNYS